MKKVATKQAQQRASKMRQLRVDATLGRNFFAVSSASVIATPNVRSSIALFPPWDVNLLKMSDSCGNRKGYIYFLSPDKDVQGITHIPPRPAGVRI
ncbi:MAG: hypothetical protein M8357_07190 [Desulfobulbaceae bacterium]|nr:hypothetical protein [Desulfobulbaceae bacterium]